MAELMLAQKARLLIGVHKPARLYRSICKEVPRILAIFDIDIPAVEAKSKVRDMFAKNAQIRDERVLDMLVEKGYMELEETLLQHKQRPHLLRLLDGDSISYTGANRKKLGPNPTAEESFARN